MKKRLISIFIILLVLSVGLLMMVFLSTSMPGESVDQLKPLTERQLQMAERMKHHVQVLAGDIGERHYHQPKAYQAAADYIKQAFIENKYVPYAEVFGAKQQYQNVIAEHYGTTSPDEIIVLGAHYDTVWMTPGADDNASGVAVMLELARQLKEMQLDKSIRFIAFANEEYPHFLKKTMGSLYHVKRSTERGDNIIAMLSLEMLGYYSDEPNSQNYPRPFNYLYPDTANFVAFVSDFSSRELLRQSISTFRASAEFPSEGIAAPVALVPDVRRSDQAAFWRYNIPAFMVTDTMAYRNYAYHNVSDVPNSLDYESMVRVTSGLLQVILGIANK